MGAYFRNVSPSRRKCHLKIMILTVLSDRIQGWHLGDYKSWVSLVQSGGSSPERVSLTAELRY